MVFICNFGFHLKKLLYISLAFFYLVLSTKASASIHLCGKSITNISFFGISGGDKCECGEMTDNSCCSDLTIQLKTDDCKINLPHILKTNQGFKVVLFHHFYSFKNIVLTQKLGYNYSSYNIKPPLILAQLNAVFLRI